MLQYQNLNTSNIYDKVSQERKMIGDLNLLTLFPFITPFTDLFNVNIILKWRF